MHLLDPGMHYLGIRTTSLALFPYGSFAWAPLSMTLSSHSQLDSHESSKAKAEIVGFIGRSNSTAVSNHDSLVTISTWTGQKWRATIFQSL